MKLDQLYDLGKPIVEQLSYSFFAKNREAYQIQGITVEDLQSYLWEVLYAKYAPTVEKNPTYYDEESFKKSFFVGGRKALLSHVKKYIQSRKRGDFIKKGAIYLNSPHPTTGMETELGSEQEDEYLKKVKHAVDKCDNPLAQRALFLVATEKYSSKNQLRKRLQLPINQFNFIWAEIQKALSDFVFTPQQEVQIYE